MPQNQTQQQPLLQPNTVPQPPQTVPAPRPANPSPMPTAANTATTDPEKRKLIPQTSTQPNTPQPQSISTTATPPPPRPQSVPTTSQTPQPMSQKGQHMDISANVKSEPLDEFISMSTLTPIANTPSVPSVAGVKHEPNIPNDATASVSSVASTDIKKEIEETVEEPKKESSSPSASTDATDVKPEVKPPTPTPIFPTPDPNACQDRRMLNLVAYASEDGSVTGSSGGVAAGGDLDGSGENAGGGSSSTLPGEWQRLALQRSLQNLVHACQCEDANCPLPPCHFMKRVFQHAKSCETAAPGCLICKSFIAQCIYHAKNCQDNKCPVPDCMNLKHLILQRRIAFERRIASMSEQSSRPKQPPQHDFTPNQQF